MSNLGFQQFVVAKYLSTWFGIGLLNKKGAGTLGSLAAFFTLPILIYNINLYLIFIIFITVIGIWASEKYCSCINVADANEVVIDEVAGQALVFYLISLSGVNLLHFIAGFFLFRIFDILKPFPINLVDKYMKNGLGIMLDDLLAGGAAFIAYIAILNFVK